MEKPTYGWQNLYVSISASGFHLVFNIIIIALFFVVGQTVDMVQQIDSSDSLFSAKLIGLFFYIVYFSLLCWSSLRMIFDLSTLSACEQSFDSAIEYLTSPEDNDRTVYYGGKFGIAFPRFIAVLLPLFISVFSFIKGYDNVGIYSLAAAVFIFLLLVVRNSIEIGGEQVLSHRGIFAFLLVTVVILSGFAIFLPSLFTFIIFGLNLILIGLGSMMFGLTLASYLFFDIFRSRKKDSAFYGFIKRPYPIFIFAIGVPIIAGVLPWSDNHQIRMFDDEETTIERQYDSLDEAFTTFTSHVLEKGIAYQLDENTKIVPVFFVASQGGGLRAAYWTSLALAHLETQLPGFENNIFALTGASGGSVGNAIYLASRQINDARIENLSCQPSEYLKELARQNVESFTSRFCLLDKAVGKDYLSSVTTSFLYNDLLYSFAPLPIPIYSRDRAAYLEKAFERGFENVYLKSIKNNSSAGLAQPYMSLYSGDKNDWEPILMGTATVQELGMLALYAPFKINADVFSNKIDLFEIINEDANLSELTDMRISTVALNSARFPYITPTGTIDATKDRADKLHLADAGYFDNFGASTTSDMISELFLSGKTFYDGQQIHSYNTSFEDVNEVDSQNQAKTQEEIIFLPIPVILTNSLFEGLQDANNNIDKKELGALDTRFNTDRPAIHTDTSSWFAHEITSPLQALVSIRGGLANTMLHEMIEQQERFIDDVNRLKGSSDIAANNLSRMLFNNKPMIVFNYNDLNTDSPDIKGRVNDEQKGINPPLGWWLSDRSKCKLSTQIIHYFQSSDLIAAALAQCNTDK